MFTKSPDNTIPLNEEQQLNPSQNNNILMSNKKSVSMENESFLNKKLQSSSKQEKTYPFGYTISLLNDDEEGLIEDFMGVENHTESNSDFFNYGLDEDKYIKILNHSILLHYERKLIEENELRKKQQMTMNPMKPNNPNNSVKPNNSGIMTQINPMLFYQQYYYYKMMMMQQQMRNGGFQGNPIMNNGIANFQNAQMNMNKK